MLQARIVFVGDFLSRYWSYKPTPNRKKRFKSARPGKEVVIAVNTVGPETSRLGTDRLSDKAHRREEISVPCGEKGGHPYPGGHGQRP